MVKVDQSMPAESSRFCKNPLLIFLLIGSLFPSCSSQVGPVTVVSVFNQKGHVKLLSKRDDLSRFERLWLAKTEETPPANLKWLYRIDVSTETTGSRWLYDRTGWLRILSVSNTKVYKIPSPEEFNQLLGIE